MSGAPSGKKVCPLAAHHTHEPGHWGYCGPTSYFLRRHIACRCKGCGLLVIWIKR